MRKRDLLLLGVLAISIFLVASRQAPVAAQAAKPAEPLQVQETNETNVVAEFTECKRKEGVLTVRIRLRNTGTTRAEFKIIGMRNYDEFYVTAGDKKHFILRDDEKTPLAPPTSMVGSIYVDLQPGASWQWWAKYPAPPAEVQKINYIWPMGAPFEDIPISDQ